MPFFPHFVEARKLLCIRAQGVLTPKHLHDCVVAYHRHPDFFPTIDLLFVLDDDLTIEIADRPPGAKSADAERLDSITRLVRAARGVTPYRTACASGTEHDRTFFLASFEMINRHTETAAFASVPEALRWLGASDDTRLPFRIASDPIRTVNLPKFS